MSNQILKAIFASEKSERKPVVVVEYGFSDPFGHSTIGYTNSEFPLKGLSAALPSTVLQATRIFSFAGDVNFLRQKNRRYLDYASGYVYFSTPGVASSNKYKKNQEYVALFPRDKFLDVFTGARELATEFEKCRKALVKEWNQINLPEAMYGKRYPVQKVFTLFSHQWRSKVHYGVTEQAEYELGINTYGFTQKQLHSQFPEAITSRDVKARERETQICGSLRSTKAFPFFSSC